METSQNLVHRFILLSPMSCRTLGKRVLLAQAKGPPNVRLAVRALTPLGPMSNSDAGAHAVPTDLSPLQTSLLDRLSALLQGPYVTAAVSG